MSFRSSRAPAAVALSLFATSLIASCAGEVGSSGTRRIGRRGRRPRRRVGDDGCRGKRWDDRRCGHHGQLAAAVD